MKPRYEETYSRMSDDEILRLASQWGELTEAAQAALGAELGKRGLQKEKPVALEPAAKELAGHSLASATLPYRWGKFQGWFFVVGSAFGLFLMAQIAIQRNDYDMLLFAPISFLSGGLGWGLLKKSRFVLRVVYALPFLLALVLAVYIMTQRIAGVGLDGGLVVRALIGILFWYFCAKYYYRRRAEFH